MKILVIRFSSIGDIVLTSPILRCVKKQLNAEIHFLCKEQFSELIRYNPHIHKIHLYNRNLKQVIRDLRSEHFDLIIDLHKNTRSRILRLALGRKSIAFNKLNFRKWLFTSFKIDLLPEHHLVDRYFSSLEKIGLKNDGAGLEQYHSGNSAILIKYGLHDLNYFVLAIGGTYVTKRMLNSQIRDVIKRLNGRIVMIGGKNDLADSNEVALGMQEDKVIDLCGLLSLDESMIIIANGSGILCHDSGMMHIAAAFDKKVISVWGNTHPKFGMYPYMVREHSVQKEQYHIHQVELGCRPCSKLGFTKCPKGHFNCMRQQNIEEIVNNCNSVESIQ